MARVLILTFGSRGDVQPFVALGAVLAQRGHEVTVCTGQGFDELITSRGLRSNPLSIDIRDVLDAPEVQAAMKSFRGWIRAFRANRSLMQRQMDDMWAVVQQESPNMIVYHPKAFAAPYFARALGVAAIPAFLQPAFVPTGAFPNPIFPLPDLGSFGNRLTGRLMGSLTRFGYGSLLRPWLARTPAVPASPSLNAMGGYHPKSRPIPILHAHSRHVVPKPADWGPDIHVTGYWFTDPDSDWVPPDDLARFLASGPPPAYVGFGSMPQQEGSDPSEAVLAAIRTTNTRAIIATGWGALSDAATSDNVHVLKSAPHDWLFPKCSAVVHHGGAGTTHEGLRWGRPSLVCPVFGDQPFWGRRVAALRAGPAPVPFRRLTADKLSDALAALQDSGSEAAAKALGERIRSENGTETAADLIEAT